MTNTVVAPFTTANPAVLVTTVGACHMLASAILLNIRLTFDALGDHVARLESVSDTSIRRARPELAMIELLAEAAGIGRADLALHLTSVASVFELDDSLAVRLWTEHIVVLILGDHSVAVEFDILLMHFFAAYAFYILAGRCNFTALHGAH